MRAWVLEKPGPIESAPLALRELPDPEPGPGEIRVDVAVCGLCRTDLHVVEGELAPRARGARAGPPDRRPGRRRSVPARSRFALGARVGVAWLWRACGVCAYCARGAENLCRAPIFTGWHVDGGFAERVCAPEAFVYPLPDALADDAVRRAAPVRGHHRPARAAPQRHPAGRTARAVRLRLVGAHRAADRAPRGRARLRGDPRGEPPRARARARRRVGGRPGRARRPRSSTPRCCSRRPARSFPSRSPRSRPAARSPARAST